MVHVLFTASNGKLEQENVALRNQISELVADKEIQNNQFDTVKTNFESKLQQWKVILSSSLLTHRRLSCFKIYEGK